MTVLSLWAEAVGEGLICLGERVAQGTPNSSSSSTVVVSEEMDQAFHMVQGAGRS